MTVYLMDKFKRVTKPMEQFKQLNISKIIEKYPNISSACAYDILYLRSRNRHSEELEKELIALHKAGTLPNMTVFGSTSEALEALFNMATALLKGSSVTFRFRTNPDVPLTSKWFINNLKLLTLFATGRKYTREDTPSKIDLTTVVTWGDWVLTYFPEDPLKFKLSHRPTVLSTEQMETLIEYVQVRHDVEVW